MIPILGLAILGGSVAFASPNTNDTDKTPKNRPVLTAEQKSQMEANQTKRFNDRINRAVTNKKLTQDQADKIIAKYAELQAFKLTLVGKTPAERRAAMKTELASLKQWATDNNIPQGYIMFGGARIGKWFNHNKGQDHKKDGNKEKTSYSTTK